MEILALILLLLPVLAFLVAFPLSLIVNRLRGIDPGFPTYFFACSVWPWVLFLSFFILHYVMMIPEQLLNLFFPEPVAAILLILLWLMVIFFEAAVYYILVPAYLTHKKVGREPLFAYGTGLLFLAPYIASIVHILREFFMDSAVVRSCGVLF